MSSDVQMRPLGALGVLDRGRSRHRPRYAPHLYGGKYPFIQTGDIKASAGKITSFSQTYSEAGLKQSRLWDAGTLCITIAANIAETAILTFPACFPDSVVGFIGNSELVDTRYVEYALRHLRSRIQVDATGSVQDNINLEYLRKCEIPVFPLREQKAIAHILGTLDDKIELNRKTNETLEAMARALFQSWFVDFDPVRAKAAGRPTGLPEEISELFPDSFEESELGEIPRGWLCLPLADRAICLSRGISPSYCEEGGVLVLNQKCIRNSRVSFEKARRHDPTKRQIAGREVKRYDSLVNSTGVGTLGRVAMMPACQEVVVVDSHVSVVRGSDDKESFFISSTLVNRQAEIEALGEGSTGQTELPRAVLGSLLAIFPSSRIISAFFDCAHAVQDKIEANVQNSLALVRVRDTLLPKLISGELRIPEAEKLLEQAGV